LAKIVRDVPIDLVLLNVHRQPDGFADTQWIARLPRTDRFAISPIRLQHQHADRRHQ